MTVQATVTSSVDQRTQPGQRLTDLELTILRQLAAGAHDPEIAKALDIADRTYRRHVTAMQRRLGARTRAHAVALGLRAGLLDPAAQTNDIPKDST